MRLYSCTGNPEKIVSEKLYFDLEGFFDQQIAELYKDSLIVLKTSEINGNTDQHEMQWTDWKKELAPFYSSDINKVSFAGKYISDTSSQQDNNEGVKVITYRATDPSLRTRIVEVTTGVHSNDILLIHIENKSGDFLSTNSEDLYYVPLKSYIIRSTRTMKFFGDNKIAVKGDIVSKQRKYF